MRPRLWHRWFLHSAGLVLLGLAAMLFAQQQAFRDGLLSHARALEQARLPALAEELAAQYQRDGGWHRLVRGPANWMRVLRARPGRDAGIEGEALRLGPPPPWQDGPRRGGPPPPRFRGGPERDAPPPPPRPPAALDFVHRVGLLDADKRPLIGPLPDPDAALQAIQVADATVGYLALTALPQLHDDIDLDFARGQMRSAALIAIVVVLVAALASLSLSRLMLRRVEALAAASRALSSGDFSRRVGPLGRDELGDLARDFDHLAETLQRGREARDRWIADISHELRTPLTILRGELHALQDGIRPLDAAAVESIAVEADRLSQRIDDLYALALSDSGGLRYRFSVVDLGELVEGVCERLAPAMLAARLKLTPDLPPRTLLTHGDPDRLEQLVTNLLSNSMRYTDPGGHIEVGLRRAAPDLIELRIEDSAPGVEPHDLPHLFERHHRGEGSEARAPGGAGLGLSICRNIVEAHGGSISAAASPLGGLAIRIEFPLHQLADTA